jgi:hypothetical protein
MVDFPASFNESEFNPGAAPKEKDEEVPEADIKKEEEHEKKR